MKEKAQFIIDMLEFATYKMKRVRDGQDECSQEELTSIRDLVAQLLNVRATTDELADYYGKSREAVRAALSRHYIPEAEQPTRRRSWRVAFFAQAVAPRNWKR